MEYRFVLLRRLFLYRLNQPYHPHVQVRYLVVPAVSPEIALLVPKLDQPRWIAATSQLECAARSHLVGLSSSVCVATQMECRLSYRCSIPETRSTAQICWQCR